MFQRMDRRAFVCLATVFALSSIMLTASLAKAETVVRVGGTGSATELFNKLNEAFKASHPGHSLSVVPSLGSTGGILAVRDGALDLSIAARHLKPEEAAQLNEASLAKTPFLLVTSYRDPKSVALDGIAKFYADPQVKWDDGTPINVVLRPRNESDNLLIGRLFPGVADAIEKARQRPEIPVAINDQDNANLATKLSGSLAGMSLMQLILERPDLRAIPIDGRTGTLSELESGRYPFARELLLVTSKTPSPGVETFVAFLKSSKGIEVLRAAGCLPTSTEATRVTQ